VDANGAEELRTSPDRLLVGLDELYPKDSPEVAGITGSEAVRRADAFVRLPGELGAEGADPVEVTIETLASGDPLWTPRAAEGRPPTEPDEVLISGTAAEDLGAGVGDEVFLAHPERRGPERFATVDSVVRISGLHPDPFRFPVFMDPAAAESFGVAGAVNSVEVVPADGLTPDEAKRALFGLPGVASIDSAATLNESLEEGLDDFAAVIRVVTVIAVILVLLIAFNSTAINVDERAREHATMFAYGLPVRTVLRLAVIESLIMGILATALGIAIGVGILSWVVNSSLEEILPDLGVIASLSGTSILLAGVAGAGAMALAPLLTTRRLRRTDIPSTLRVLE
jgi:putative ABC transport system permease protein